MAEWAEDFAEASRSNKDLNQLGVGRGDRKETYDYRVLLREAAKNLAPV